MTDGAKSNPSCAVPGKPAGAYRVLHTADWHLGKLLGEHSREEEHARFLSFLLEAVCGLSVDVLVVAGDVFDSANPPQSAVAQYFGFVSRLYRQGGCELVVVAGNHDSPAQLEAPREVLRQLGAHVVGVLPQEQDRERAMIVLPSAERARLVIAAVPFLRDRDLRVGQPGQDARTIEMELKRGIAGRYEEMAGLAQRWVTAGVPCLATWHLTVAGGTTSDSEREIHVGGLGAVGADCFPPSFAYVALGHLHRPQQVGGRAEVRYAGSPIPLSFGEARDLKEVRILDFVGAALVWQGALPVPPSRRLVQLQTEAAVVEGALAALGAGARDGNELTPWVEVVVENIPLGEDIVGRIGELSRGKNYEVVRILPKPRSREPFFVEGGEDPTAAEGLLASPSRVFQRRLELEPGLSAEDREGLETLFKELRDLHAEAERESVTPEPAVGGGAA